TPSRVAFRSKVRPHAGKTSWRIMNENADATRAMQLATNSRRGFMPRVSETKDAPPHRGNGLKSCAGLLLDNRVACVLPVGSRTHPDSGLGVGSMAPSSVDRQEVR